MDKLEALKQEMLETLPEKRFSHVLAVVEMAEYMAEVFSLDKEEVMTAAILHDCTKPLFYNEHLKLFEKYSHPLTEADLKSGEVLHAKTGALIAKNFYRQSDKVYSMIYTHTTGRENMTTEEKVIFLADFIEKTRPYPISKTIRQTFLNGIDNSKTSEDKLHVLNAAVYTVLDHTLGHLKEKGVYTHPDTVLARDYLSNILFQKTEEKA